MRRWPLVILLLAVVLYTSCETNSVFEKNKDIPNYNWSSDYKLQYPVEIKDTSVRYNIYINVRHADFYQFSNLWVFVSTTFPDGKTLKKRIEIPLASPEGAWFGEGMGDIWDRSFMIQQNAIFTKPGTYTFELEQNMRLDPLPGIMAMGVRIENTSVKK